MSQLNPQDQTLSTTTPLENANVPSKIIPVHITDASTFDDSFSFLKERFAAEMKRMDEEMNKFSIDLMNMYGESSSDTSAPLNWGSLAGSPLIQGEGENMSLKLHFDVSQFDPNEITVQLTNNMLVITAVHAEKNDTTSVVREFKREFLLPKGIDPNSVKSSLSREGVLRILAPLPPLTPAALDTTFIAVQEEESSVLAIVNSSKETLPTPNKDALEKSSVIEQIKEHIKSKEPTEKKSLHKSKPLAISKQNAQ